MFSCYQKSGGPGAAVRCGDCRVRTPTTYAAGFGYRSEVNGCGALPLPPWPTHVTTCRLLFFPGACGGLEPTRSVRPHACVVGLPTAVYAHVSEGLDYVSRVTLCQPTLLVRSARTCPSGCTVHEHPAQTPT